MLDNSFQVRNDKLPIATYAISEPPFTVSMPFMLTHHHREFEVIAVVCGKCEVTIDQVRYTAQRGDLLLIPPYSLHSGRILHLAGYRRAHVLQPKLFLPLVPRKIFRPCRPCRTISAGITWVTRCGCGPKGLRVARQETLKK